MSPSESIIRFLRNPLFPEKYFSGCPICGWFRSEGERIAGEWDGKLLGNQKGLTAEVITAKENNNNDISDLGNQNGLTGDEITAKANNNNSFSFHSPAVLSTSDFWKDFWE